MYISAPYRTGKCGLRTNIEVGLTCVATLTAELLKVYCISQPTGDGEKAFFDEIQRHFSVRAVRVAVKHSFNLVAGHMLCHRPVRAVSLR